MANKNPLNKNSMYVQSLVDFILDTKPYHSKLTDVVEEYRFSDDINVKIDERFSSKAKFDSTWLYNYFSSANPMFRTMPAQKLVPAFSSDTFVVGKNENTDLALVPFVYSKKAFDGPGINSVYIHRPEFSEALTESVDYFQSHGSFQFQIKQTTNANGEFVPLWAITPDDDLIAEARQTTINNALDTSNPASATNRIRALLDEIKTAVQNTDGGHSEVMRELDILYRVLDSGDLPGRKDWSADFDASVSTTYSPLFAWLAIPNEKNNLVQLPAPHDREWFEQQFSFNSAPLFFGMFTDVGVRESGLAEYRNVENDFLRVTDFHVRKRPDIKETTDIEEWTFTALDDSNTYRINGSSSGFIGFVTAGETFDNGRVSFNTALLSQSIAGEILSVEPTRKLVIAEDALLETWNVIKVNPIAHNRPRLDTKRYGYVKDLAGVIGSVTILDNTLPNGDIVLTARGDGAHFDLTSTANQNYKTVVQVGVPYNDGKLAFTIVRGTVDFFKGDRFYIAIDNPPVRIENLELGYGYDMDPYDDHDVAEYPNGNKIGFYYDGRFTDYDLSSLNLQIGENAVDGRKWRIRALPDYARGITTVPGIPGVSNDLPIYFAGSFAVEYSDNDFNTKTSVATMNIGATFTSEEHGISFTLAEGSKPFVAVSADNGIEGGDTFSFEVTNDPPQLIDAPVSLSSISMPRLIMHSDSFYEAPEANWEVKFSDIETYTVTGVSPDGTAVYGPIVAKIPTVGVDPREGYSFKGLGIHFTIVPASGLEADDKFIFQTYAEKASYLVHGSVTGWTAPATVGKYYWNGKIGFKIRAPYATTYIDGQKVEVAKDAYTIREDCPSLLYTFTKNRAGYQVTRSDTGAIGFCSATELFRDTYLTIDLAGVTVPTFQLSVDAHDYPLWNTADVAIINPRSKARLPNTGDIVVVEKMEEGRLALNLVQRDVNISALNPITIDQRFIDTNTHGLPLAQTSPETALLQGWIPLTATKMDSETSIAEFSDVPQTYIFKSAVNSDQAIGTLKQNVFEWDQDFYAKYLPLNAEANLVFQGTGWNDKVSTRISESVKFLLGSNAAIEDWLFKDTVRVKFDEDNKLNIVSKYNGEIRALVEDGPFGGFLAGYGNTPYDTVGYDPGIPPNVESLLSNPNLTEQQRKDIFDQWNNYLNSPVVPTTEAQWAYLRAALAGDPNPGLLADEIGFPSVGMGMDITDKPENSASASITEIMAVRAIDKSNLLESNNYDIGLLDARDENTVIMYSGSMPPIPDQIPPGTTYETLQTPLTVDVPARTFEILFNAPANVLATFSPTFSIWLPGEPRAVQVTVVERVKPGVFRFSMARLTEAKIIVG